MTRSFLPGLRPVRLRDGFAAAKEEFDREKLEIEKGETGNSIRSMTHRLEKVRKTLDTTF
jgi:hypothetical protein